MNRAKSRFIAMADGRFFICGNGAQPRPVTKGEIFFFSHRAMVDVPP